MSKKTRKKTSKTTASKAAKKPLGKTSKASSKTSSTASSKTSPGKTTRTASAKPGKKSAVKAVATKPKTGKSAAKKPLREKARSPSPGTGLAEGAKAPAFHLPRDGGETVSLADYAGKKLVIFFYPRADTPGCTREAIDFTRLAGDFAEADTAVLGVSADPMKAQEAFRNKHQLAVPLASDEKHGMLDAYGVWGEKSMYGKIFQGVLRTTVLIGSDGRVLRIWRGVKVDGHADEVLAAARTL